MKRRFLFALCFFAASGFSVYAQKVTMNLQKVKLETVFNEITQQTGLSVAYSRPAVNPEKIVSVSANQEELADVLKRLFAGTGITFEIGKQRVFLRNASLEQKPQGNVPVKTVSGVIVDENGDPVIGASVVVKGTSTGTITDLDGKYVLQDVPENATLDISYVGYETLSLKASDKDLARITMREDTEKLDEVVVVGYGTQKKVSVTGSMASTKGSDLSKVPTPNITNTLAGRLPGLISYNRSGEPGYDDAGLLIRGASTTGDASPLIVVDGVADRAGSLGRIDPNDIESITILKDASAAIYGSRAANGVVLVTTKRGSSDRLTINYNGNVGISSPTILPDMCESWQYAELLNEITPGSYSNEDIQKFKDGSDPLNYPNVNALDVMLKQAVLTQHNASASAGGKYISFYASLGYKYQDNYYKNSASNYSQYNFRTNIDFTPHKDVKVGLNVAFRQEDRNSPITGSEDIWRYLLKYNPMVNIWFPGTNYGNVSSSQDNFSPATGVDGTSGYQRDRQSYLNADLTLHWDLPWITEGLSIDAGLYIDRADVFYKNFQKKYYLYQQVGDTYQAQEQGQNILDQNMHQTLGITMNARLNYKRTFNEVHNLNVFVAYEQYKSRYDYMQARRQDFISSSLDELFAGDANSATNNGNASETARMNYFGRLDYDYAGKYLFQFNWRYDGSENFPKGNRFGFFPGVSIGWRISEEDFWKENVEWMDYLKIRASWGQMGNDKVSAFQYMTAYTYDNPAILNGGVINNGLWLLRTANPNITWEVANTYNVGIEAKFLNYFNFEADFFKTKRNNILATRNAAIPEYAGLTLPDENIGICSNIGTELTLGFAKQINQDWRVMASGNFTYNHSTIDFIDEPSETLPWQRRTGLSIGWTESMQSSIVDETELTWLRGCEVHNFARVSPSDLGRMNGGWYGWDNRSWATKWNNITNCNIFFERIDNVSFTDEEMKNRLKGEVRFLRVFEYNDLIMRWGGVPLITKSFTINDVDEIKQQVRASYEDCVDFMVSELDQAAEELPATYSGNDYGRATSVAALALKARILLYAASPLMNENVAMPEIGYTNPDPNRWQKAAEAADAAVTAAEAAGYKLLETSSKSVEDLAANYQNIFLDNTSANTEVLFARMGTASNLGENLSSLEQWNFPNGWGGWGGNCPLQELVDDYEVVDAGLTQAEPFNWANPEMAASPYENRDPRFYASILYDGAPWKERTLETYFTVDASGNETGGGQDTRYGRDDWNTSPTGYNMKKFMDESYVGNSYNFSAKNWIWIRMAELYLNQAEAWYHAGDENKARTAVNKVRNRAGMPDIVSSGEQLLEDIKHERRIELVFEEHRYYDVRRWKEADKYLGRMMHAITVKLHPDGHKTYEVSDLRSDVGGNRLWDDKMYWLPIMRSEIEKNSNLTQNPGYTN